MKRDLRTTTRRTALGLLGLAPVSLAMAPWAAQGQIDRARQLLLQGDAVVYFRHGATTWSGIDQLDWPRERQRLLSDLGIAQSEQIGEAFRRQGYQVGEVLASPFARCRDMAEIAFGRVEERMELVGLLSDAQGRRSRMRYLRTQLSTPTNGANRILVAHRSNIAEVAGVRLEEGGAAVVSPTTEGFEVLTTLVPAAW